jgi:hypothetical protein
MVEAGWVGAPSQLKEPAIIVCISLLTSSSIQPCWHLVLCLHSTMLLALDRPFIKCVCAHAASALHATSQQHSPKAAATPLLHAANAHGLLLPCLSLPLQRSA